MFAACGRKSPLFAAFAVLKTRALCYALINEEHKFYSYAHPPRKELLSCRQQQTPLLQQPSQEQESAAASPAIPTR
jgi:hypothetical protein